MCCYISVLPLDLQVALHARPSELYTDQSINLGYPQSIQFCSPCTRFVLFANCSHDVEIAITDGSHISNGRTYRTRTQHLFSDVTWPTQRGRPRRSSRGQPKGRGDRPANPSQTSPSSLFFCRPRLTGSARHASRVPPSPLSPELHAAAAGCGAWGCPGASE